MGERGRWASRCAYGAAALALVVPVVGGLARDGYSHTAQFISELGERGADHGVAVSVAGFLPTGLLVLAFGVLAARDLRGSRLLAGGVLLAAVAIAIGYAVSGVARCEAGCPTDGDLQQSIHNAVGYVEYGGAPIGFALVAWASRRRAGWRLVAAWSAGATILFLAIAPLVEQEQRRSSRGTLQRVLEVLLWGWVVLVGHRLARDEPGADAVGAQAETS